MRPATQNAPNSTSTLLRHNSIWLLQQQFRIAKKAYQTHTSWRVLVGKPGLLFRATAVLWNYVARILYHKYGRLSRGLGGFSNLGLSKRYQIRRYKIQDIETGVAVRVFTYLVSLYLVTCISPINCNLNILQSPKYGREYAERGRFIPWRSRGPE